MYIFSVAQQPKSEAGRLILRFLVPTQLDTRRRARAHNSPLNAVSASRRGRFLLITQQTASVKHPWPQLNSKPLCQKSSDGKPTPQTIFCICTYEQYIKINENKLGNNFLIDQFAGCQSIISETEGKPQRALKMHYLNGICAQVFQVAFWGGGGVAKPKTCMHFYRLSCAIHALSITSFFIWSNKYYYARSPNRESSDSVFFLGLCHQAVLSAQTPCSSKPSACVLS